MYLTSGALHPVRSKYAKPSGAASDFFRNGIKEKHFPADARPKEALQPESHDCCRIKGILYLTRLQRAPSQLLYSPTTINAQESDFPTFSNQIQCAVIHVCSVASPQAANPYQSKHSLKTRQLCLIWSQSGWSLHKKHPFMAL